MVQKKKNCNEENLSAEAGYELTEGELAAICGGSEPASSPTVPGIGNIGNLPNLATLFSFKKNAPASIPTTAPAGRNNTFPSLDDLGLGQLSNLLGGEGI